MRGLGTLVFWTLLSLSAVVVSSYGQTPMPMNTAAPMVMVPPQQMNAAPVPGVTRAFNFPAIAQPPAQAVIPAAAPSVIPTAMPKNYIAPPQAAATSVPAPVQGPPQAATTGIPVIGGVRTAPSPQKFVLPGMPQPTH